MTVPVDPDESPTLPFVSVTVPLLPMVSLPAIDPPTTTSRAWAPGPFTAVGFGAIVSMKALEPGVGTVPLCQLPPMNQSLDVLPVQMLCAPAGERVATARTRETLNAISGCHFNPACAYPRFAISDAFLRHCWPRECLAITKP